MPANAPPRVGTAPAVARAPDHQEHADHHDERHAVDRERRGRAPRGDHDAGQERAERTSCVELRAVERHRVQQHLAGHQFGDERLPDRRVDPAGESRQERQGRQRRDGGRPGRDQAPQGERAQCLAGLRGDQQPPTGVAVGERATDEAHHHERHVLEEARDADVAGAAGQREGHIGHRGVLHPPAGVRHQRRQPEPPEVAVGQRQQRRSRRSTVDRVGHLGGFSMCPCRRRPRARTEAPVPRSPTGRARRPAPRSPSPRTRWRCWRRARPPTSSTCRSAWSTTTPTTSSTTASPTSTSGAAPSTCASSPAGSTTRSTATGSASSGRASRRSRPTAARCSWPTTPAAIPSRRAGHHARHRDRARSARATGSPTTSSARCPVIGTLWSRLGGLPAHPDNAYRLLREQGQLVLVFPEGAKGPAKTYDERYQLRRFGRGGFVEIAMRAGVPGRARSPWSAPRSRCRSLLRIPSLARALGLPYVPAHRQHAGRRPARRRRLLPGQVQAEGARPGLLRRAAGPGALLARAASWTSPRRSATGSRPRSTRCCASADRSGSGERHDAGPAAPGATRARHRARHLLGWPGRPGARAGPQRRRDRRARHHRADRRARAHRVRPGRRELLDPVAHRAGHPGRHDHPHVPRGRPHPDVAPGDARDQRHRHHEPVRRGVGDRRPRCATSS